MSERKRTNAEIDAINSMLTLEEGDTPLPYETVDNTNTENSGEQNRDDAEKLKSEADTAQKILDDAGKNKNADTSEKEKIAAPLEVELDDEKILAYLEKTRGKKFAAVEDFINPKKELTPDERKAQAEQRDANKIAYGLSKGIFTKNQLEEFITDTKNPKDLVFAAYAADQKAKDDTLTDAEIEEEFAEKFGLNEDKESRKYKAGQNLVNNIADNLIGKKHSKILNLENDFTSHETAQLQQKERENKILSQAPIYKKDVEEIRAQVKKVSFQIDENETFETELDDKIVDEVIAEVLDNNFSQKQIENGWSKEVLKQSVQTAGILKQLPKLFASYADKKILEKQMGVRGVPPDGKQGGKVLDKVELNERQKAAISHYGLSETIAN